MRPWAHSEAGRHQQPGVRMALSLGTRRALLWFILLSFTVFPLAAGNGIILQRDHGGWTMTVRGSVSSPQRQITLIAGGDITVVGGRTKEINYTIVEEVRGGSEREARETALRMDAAIKSQDGSASLTFPWMPVCSRQPVRLEIPRGIAKVTVVSLSGNIDVAELDGSVITRNGAGHTTLDHIGGDVEIRTAGGGTTLGLIGGSVHCVSGGGPIQARTIRGESVFETSGGEIYAAEALGAVRAYTGAGGIRIGHAGSSVTATTQGGLIEVGRAAGLVVANNSAGPIRVSSAPGVRCVTVSGAIRLNGVSGSVTASTTLGNIVASFLGAGLMPGLSFGPKAPLDERLSASSFLQTGGGDITVLIPSNISVTLQATSTGSAGTIVSDFPLRLNNRGATLTAEGLINGGGPVLQIAAKGGTISIKRQ
jgi:hypothetical protein